MIFKKKPSGKKVALIVLNVILSCVFVALLAFTVYAEWLMGRFYQGEEQTATLSPEQVEALLQEDLEETKPEGITEVKPEEVQWDVIEKQETTDEVFNILLVGQDRRPGEIRARSDTMILITINTRDYTVSMSSFMRDIYVQIPGYQANRLNVPYVLGGFQSLADTLELNFGVRPDRYVEVDFSGFEKIVDTVGGVDVEMTEAEVAYFNAKFQFGATLGVNHLDGKKALTYARCRSIEGDGDFSRTRRQRTVVAAVIAKARTLNLVQINEAVLAMTDVLTTNLTAAEIMSYVVRFYPMLDKLAEPEQIQVPANGTYYLGWVDGIGSVIMTDLKANSAIIAATQK